MSEPEIVVLEETTTAVIRAVVPMAELRGFFDRSFTTLFRVVAAQGVTPAGAAFGLYRANRSIPSTSRSGSPRIAPCARTGRLSPARCRPGGWPA